MTIRLIRKADAVSLAEYYTENVDHFKRWEPRRPYGFNTAESWKSRIEDYVSNQDAGVAAYFISIDDTNHKIQAHCTLSQISYGSFMACCMGYAVAAEYQGQGIMYQTCQIAIDYAFTELKLHRIMANYMPHNNRSAKLLKRLGFVSEGLAKDYLKINDRWENHVLTSLTNKKIT